MAAAVKRSYNSSRRREQTAATRRHVVEVSRSFFLTDGYVATSMRDVADTAGVSLQTLYNMFRSKFGLFSALMDVVVAGDHERVSVTERPNVVALEQITDPKKYVAGLVAVAVPVLHRLNAIYPVLQAAAASHAEVARAYRTFAIDA